MTGPMPPLQNPIAYFQLAIAGAKAGPKPTKDVLFLGSHVSTCNPKNTFPWAWDSLNTRDTVSKLQEMGGNGCKGRPRTAQSALFLPGAGTHPYNHHLH